MSTRLPRILIIGKNGQVGWELRRTLAPVGEVTAIDFPDIDLTQPDSLREWVQSIKPDVLVNAAAYTQVDKAESDYERALAINGTAPGILAQECQRLGALMVHYSTDYVFDGAKRTPYVETDLPNPANAYGRTKLAGDEAVASSGADHLIFRLCWVYGARGQNFMLTMMRLARERDQLRVVGDQIGCPTWSRMIAETTAHAVRTTLSASDRAAFNGTYHAAASGETSWHGFASEIIRLMPAEGKKCSSINAIATSEYPTPAKRPAYSVLSCYKLEHIFQLRLPDWRESLQQVLDA